MAARLLEGRKLTKGDESIGGTMIGEQWVSSMVAATHTLLNPQQSCNGPLHQNPWFFPSLAHCFNPFKAKGFSTSKMRLMVVAWELEFAGCNNGRIGGRLEMMETFSSSTSNYWFAGMTASVQNAWQVTVREGAGLEVMGSSVDPRLLLPFPIDLRRLERRHNTIDVVVQLIGASLRKMSPIYS